MSEPLDDLLARLCQGDMAAAESVFVKYEPYLRKAIRRQLPQQLRSKFDSEDILQSVWTDLLQGFREAGWRFPDADQLRGFLYVATRNRLIDRIRKHRKALELEEPLPEAGQPQNLVSQAPSPSAVAQADDLWQRLVACCPPEHRLALDLRRQGYSLAEVGARTGLHPDSVRRILRTLARQTTFGETPTCPPRDGET